MCFANSSHRLAIAYRHRQRSGSVGDAGGRAPDRLVQLVRAVGRPRCQRGILSRASWRGVLFLMFPPPEEMPERQDHDRNIIANVRINPCAKSFILCVYDVWRGTELLARNNMRFARHPLTMGASADGARTPSTCGELDAQTDTLESNSRLRRDKRWAHFKITEPQVVDLKTPSNVGEGLHRIHSTF